MAFRFFGSAKHALSKYLEPVSLWYRARRSKYRYFFARNPDYRKYGAKFLLGFSPVEIPGRKRRKYLIQLRSFTGETPVNLVLRIMKIGKEPVDYEYVEPTDILGCVSLSFEKNTVVARGIQGGHGMQSELNRFIDVTHSNWALRIFSELESQAKSLGYARVAISKPETLDSYKAPIATPERPADQIRDDMRKLYYGVAKSLGYHEEGGLLVKSL